MKLHKSFVLRNPEIWKRLVAFVKANWSTEKPLMVIVTEADKPRTLHQNAYYWAVIREIAANAWVGGRQFSAEAWHELLAREYGPVKDIELPNGNVVQTRCSTSDMNAGPFSEYIENIKAYAAGELGLELDI
jgi:hypothetical protein